jgi:hypothetical protein
MASWVGITHFTVLTKWYYTVSPYPTAFLLYKEIVFE